LRRLPLQGLLQRLIAIWWLGLSTSLGQDVRLYGVAKGQLFLQANSALATPAAGSNVVFQAFIATDGEATVTNASLTLPNSTVVPLDGSGGSELGLEAAFASLAALDAAFPDGEYTLVLGTVHDGLRTNALTLSGGGYPATPHFNNFAAAQTVNPTNDFALTWDAIAGATTNDFVQIEILDCNGSEVFQTASPGRPGGLDGTATFAIIPGRTLRPGQTYRAELLVAHLTTYDTNSYPGAQGIAGYFKRVQTSLSTAGLATGCPPGRFEMAFAFPQGSFGEGRQGSIGFPVGLSNCVALYTLSNESNPPSAITFSGPAGSGLNNTTNAFGGSGESGYAWYSSPTLNLPPFPPGGIYTVRYGGTDYQFNLLDPHVAQQQVLLVPTVITNTAGDLVQINWGCRDTAGNAVPAPSFMQRVELRVDQTTNRLYEAGGSGEEIPPSATSHLLRQTVPWTDVVRLELLFRDRTGNSFVSSWNRGPLPVQVTTASLPDGTVGSGYSQLLSAIGGAKPYQWTVELGTLPDGLSLNLDSGEIAGTPQTSGAYNFTVRVTDAEGLMANRVLTLRIFAPGAAPALNAITITPSNPTNLVGDSHQFSAVGTFSDGSSRPLTAGGAWQLRAPMGTASRALAAAFVNGRLYAISGEPITRVESYDPATDTWATNTPVPEMRVAPATAAVAGKIYVIGGDSGAGIRDTVLIYDPGLDSWSSGAPMPGGPRAGMGAAVLNDKIYVVGGFGSDYLTRTEVYDPATNTWTNQPPLAFARFTPGAGGLNGRLYVSGGYNSLGPETTLEIFDPATGQWTNGIPMPEGHTGPAAVLDGKLYFAGGGPAPRTSVVAFDPVWNTWTALTPLNVGREDMGAVADEAAHRLYVVGGYDRAYLKSLEVFTLPEVFWYSASPAVASIVADGRGTALSEGSATITAAAGSVTATVEFAVLSALNTPPSISDVPNQTTLIGQPVGPIPFAITDAETPVADLVLAVSSSDTNLVPLANIAIGGAGPNRTTTVTPAPGRSGNATITLTVSDGAATASDEFVVVVGGGADVMLTLLAKGQVFLQTNAGPPRLAGDRPFVFRSSVQEVFAGSVNGATLRLPSGNTRTLIRDGAAGLEFSQDFSTKTTLDNAYGAGAYRFLINAAHDGSRTNTATLPADAYPSTPHLANWAGAQAIDAAGDSVLEWDPFVGGTSNDFVQITVLDSLGQTIVQSPDLMAPDGLRGAATSFMIPANTLQPGMAYSGELLFAKRTSFNTNGYPSASAYFRTTRFPITTLPPPPPQGRLQFGAARYTASEDGTNAVFSVMRTGGSLGTVTVDFSTADGTAKAGFDYVASAGPLTLTNGQTSATLAVPILDDAVLEGPETFLLALRSPTGGAVLGPSSNAVMTVADNEALTSAGLLQFSATNYTVSESGLMATITVVRTGGSNGVVTVDYFTTNGTALAGLDYSNSLGTLVFSNGVKSRTFKVPVFEDTLDEPNETLGLVLSNPTGGAVLGARHRATVTLGDNDVGGVIRFSAPTYRISETNAAVTISVMRTGGVASAVSVDFATWDGTASNGVDYLGTNGTLTFAGGQRNGNFTVPILDTALAEGNRTVLLTLSNAMGGAKLGTPRSAVLTILDEEVGVLFGRPAFLINEAGTNAVISVVRAGPANQTVSVNYATSDGSASVGTDYGNRSGTLTFKPGVVSQSFKVPIVSDTLDESNETVVLTLSNPVGGLLGTLPEVTLTILDNDVGGVINFQKSVFAVSETGRVAKVTVTRSGGGASDVRVDFATADDTAMAGNDYTPTNGTLNFGAGVTSRTFTIPILDNTIRDTNKTLRLLLNNPRNGGVLGSVSNAVLTILENDLVSRFSLLVIHSGSGVGSVLRNPSASNYLNGTAVTLSAMASPGSAFTGWSGACTGTGDCQITMRSNTTVTAVFELLPAAPAELNGARASRAR
jgi:hypothetical protein